MSQGILECGIPANEEKEVILPAIVNNLIWQMDKDMKSTGLKALQGKIWKRGFEEGTLKGQ